MLIQSIVTLTFYSCHYLISLPCNQLLILLKEIQSKLLSPCFVCLIRLDDRNMEISDLLFLREILEIDRTLLLKKFNLSASSSYF